MKPIFFETPAAFRAWLKKNHKTADEIIVGFYRKDSGKKSITWSEAVDEAICFGWIDGIRRKHSEIAYSNRFTPRRPASNWSAINIAKVAELTRQKRMEPAGIVAFEKRTEAKSRVYSYEQKDEPIFDPQLAKIFKANKTAWEFFCGLSPYYRQLETRWVHGAKQEATRLRRLEKLIEACANRRRR
jgi:uncharacterized protein YdeI (YjbR/CyaY-like superfamily)